VREENWKEHFEHWRKEMRQWIADIGIDYSDDLELEVSKEERAHYSKRTIDFMYDFPFGRKELYGLAYRTDFDLKNHFKEAPYTEEGSEPFYPHVIEPTWGVDRTVLAVLLSSYREEENEKGKRVYLALKPHLAPYKAAVFPQIVCDFISIENNRDVEEREKDDQ
jgi:glycyl-tRNA synthetase